MGILLLIIAFTANNAEFDKTVAAQKKAGFKWYNLPECRVVTEGIPAITIDSVKGKRVCYKLALTRDGAK